MTKQASGNRTLQGIEDATLPKGKIEREWYLHTVGVDGFMVLDALDALKNEPLQKAAQVAALRRTWQRHYDRKDGLYIAVAP